MNEIKTITYNEVEYEIEKMTENQKGCLSLLLKAQDNLNLAAFTKDSLEKQLGELLEHVSDSD